MVKVLVYAYMNQIYSSSKIEEVCRRDINFMWLLEGKKIPDHTTIARFRTLHFAPCSKKVMAEVTEFLYKAGEISGEVIFIDGTKIEACANKYTFVWKKAVDENLKKLRKKLYALKETEGIEFVHGARSRKSMLQKSIETLEGYLSKLKEYTQKLHICGSRNSYSKTDPDATFMRMKEDAMGNGQLKAGYESEENYSGLEAKRQLTYIKPSNYEISKKRKYKKDIGRAENMEYDAQGVNREALLKGRV